jgi:hypothetical protein
VPYEGVGQKLRVAVGDINGDGVDDIVVSNNKGSGHVRAFDGLTGERMLIGGESELKPFKGSHDYGAYVAIGDVNGDGIADIIVAEGKDGSTVKAFDAQSGAKLFSFEPLGEGAGGLRVGVRDVNGDGIAEIIAELRGGDHQVRVYNAAKLSEDSQPVEIMSYKG